MSELVKKRYSVPRVLKKVKLEDLEMGRPNKPMTQELKSKLELAISSMPKKLPTLNYVAKGNKFVPLRAQKSKD